MPKSRHISLGYFEPSTLKKKKPHARVLSSQLLGWSTSSLIVVVQNIRRQVPLNDHEESICSSWGVHSPFTVEHFGDSYKMIFKTPYDHSKELSIKWTWIGFKLLIVLPWIPQMTPLEEILNTIPVQITLARLH